MAEQRKPEIKIVAEIHGKKNRLELFEASLWPDKFSYGERNRFRIRLNGRWALGNRVFTLSEVMRQLRMKLVSELGGDPDRQNDSSET